MTPAVSPKPADRANPNLGHQRATTVRLPSAAESVPVRHRFKLPPPDPRRSPSRSEPAKTPSLETLLHLPKDLKLSISPESDVASKPSSPP